jgi:hypothetical protein
LQAHLDECDQRGERHCFQPRSDTKNVGYVLDLPLALPLAGAPLVGILRIQSCGSTLPTLSLMTMCVRFSQVYWCTRPLVAVQCT